MAAVIYRTEAEGLPDDADGFVVARNDSGGRVVWCDARSYVRTTAAPKQIVSGDWLVAIERATTLARARGRPVYVVKD